MKKKLLFISMVFILLGPVTIAQKSPQDCYTTYKNRGDSYNNTRKYDLAVEQYQIAKKCKYLSNSQTRTLDSLIANINRRQRIPTITRRF
jgi:hypothetical protein